MTQYLLANEVNYQGSLLHVAKVIDDAVYDIALLQSAGAQLITLPNAPAEARAAFLRKMQARGQSTAEIAELESSFAATSTGAAVTFAQVKAALEAATASVGMNAQKFTNVLDPTAAQDAATKNYVDTNAAALTASAPANVTKSAAAVGVATTAARADHKHDVTTAAPGNVGTANAEGTATSLARSDHTHNVPFTPVQTALGAASGDVSVNNQKITNLATPVASTDAATKAYADLISQGLSPKNSVRVITTGNITLSGAQTINGVAVVAGNRVLVTAQTTGSQNGIYVAAAGAWSRAADMAAASSAAGTFMFVEEGTTGADQLWICTNDVGSDVVGTDTLVFSVYLNFLLASTAPADVTKAAAAVGTGSTAARADHKHDVSTAAAGTISVGAAAAEGAATSLARSDHTHALTAPAAPANVTKAAADAGAASTVARSDHKHDVSTAAPGATGVATASAEGTATSMARSDHAHQSNTAPVDVTKAAAAIGTSGEPARADHKHDVTTAAPGNVGTANAEGAATSLSRSDHVHAGGDKTVATGLTTTGLATGDVGYVTSTALTVAKTDADAAASSVAIGINEGTVGSMTTGGVVAAAKFTTAGGSPANGARAWIAPGTEEASAAGKLTATAPTASGKYDAEYVIVLDNSAYAASKVCKILIQPKIVIGPL